MLTNIEENVIKDAFRLVFKNNGFEDQPVEIRQSKYWPSHLYISPVSPPDKHNDYGFRLSFHKDVNGQEQVFLMIMREGNTWGSNHLISPHITSSALLANFIQVIDEEIGYGDFYPEDLDSCWR